MLAASDTTSMKPSAATRPRLAARVWIKAEIGSSLGLALKVVFSAVCISPNTPEAVISTVATPRIVAMVPEPGSLDRSRIDLMKSPPAGPSSCPSSSSSCRSPSHVSRTGLSSILSSITEPAILSPILNHSIHDYGECFQIIDFAQSALTLLSKFTAQLLAGPLLSHLEND